MKNPASFYEGVDEGTRSCGHLRPGHQHSGSFQEIGPNEQACYEPEENPASFAGIEKEHGAVAISARHQFRKFQEIMEALNEHSYAD